ncbi:hypothetical protein FRB95_000584 [Tulasnella sp. JGI-2019a]|nr:hypothetical protein FRB93_008436 [Tulasnella sp. JGI-2019a]KAG9033080.1 hypothetical protein FRB95_000584 [Tulasnella sp. JGI-2019a]
MASCWIYRLCNKPKLQPMPQIMQQGLLEQAQLIRQHAQDLQALTRALADLGQHHIPLETLDIDERNVIGRGGYGVVTRGTFSGYPLPVAVKRLRSDNTKDMRVAKRLVREMMAWSKLKHPNILPLIGFHLSDNLDLALIVCPLQPYGNVKDYLQRVKPNDLDRLGLVFDTICAVEYLHNLDPPVIHGDIKALNILMSSERRAILCDFGLAVAVDEVSSGLTTSKGFKGSLRYCSPELVMEEEARRTRPSDMWAWGCLVIEIMKETVPYAQQRSDGQVICALGQGWLPGSEYLLKDPINIWPIVCGCCQSDPLMRLTASMATRDVRLLMTALNTSAASSLTANYSTYNIERETLEIDETCVIGSGNFGVVMRGKFSGYPSAVAVKRLHPDDRRGMHVAKRLVHEMKAWSKLKHPNILPLTGCHLSDNLDLALIVCPLQPYGNVKGYLQRVKPNGLDRLRLALDTICAVEYLHNLDPPLVHGNIKALNVLMSGERRAILSDFGLAVAEDEATSDSTTAMGIKRSLRYCSPELVLEVEARRARPSDMWAWGCLAVEIMKETEPYPRLLNDSDVIFALIRGDAPATEDHLVNIWPVVQECWKVDPRIRLSASKAARNIGLLVAALDTNAGCTSANTHSTTSTGDSPERPTAHGGNQLVNTSAVNAAQERNAIKELNSRQPRMFTIPRIPEPPAAAQDAMAFHPGFPARPSSPCNGSPSPVTTTTPHMAAPPSGSLRFLISQQQLTPGRSHLHSTRTPHSQLSPSKIASTTGIAINIPPEVLSPKTSLQRSHPPFSSIHLNAHPHLKSRSASSAPPLLHDGDPRARIVDQRPPPAGSRSARSATSVPGRRQPGPSDAKMLTTSPLALMNEGVSIYGMDQNASPLSLKRLPPQSPNTSTLTPRAYNSLTSRNLLNYTNPGSGITKTSAEATPAERVPSSVKLFSGEVFADPSLGGRPQKPKLDKLNCSLDGSRHQSSSKCFRSGSPSATSTLTVYTTLKEQWPGTGGGRGRPSGDRGVEERQNNHVYWMSIVGDSDNDADGESNGSGNMKPRGSLGMIPQSPSAVTATTQRGSIRKTKRGHPRPEN